MSFIGLGISFYPYIVPPSLTIWQAAAPDASLAFLLVGALVLVPMILAYTAYAYWVFRGKVDPRARLSLMPCAARCSGSSASGLAGVAALALVGLLIRAIRSTRARPDFAPVRSCKTGRRAYLPPDGLVAQLDRALDYRIKGSGVRILAQSAKTSSKIRQTRRQISAKAAQMRQPRGTGGRPRAVAP